MTIIDTDVLIDFINGIDAAGKVIQRHMRAGRLATTIINQYELLKGSKSQQDCAVLERLFSVIKIYDLDYNSIKVSADISKKLKKSGNQIPDPGALIAGIAVSQGETIVTEDAHFSKVEGLRIEHVRVT